MQTWFLISGVSASDVAHRSGNPLIHDPMSSQRLGKGRDVPVIGLTRGGGEQGALPVSLSPNKQLHREEEEVVVVANA